MQNAEEPDLYFAFCILHWYSFWQLRRWTVQFAKSYHPRYYRQFR
jgi:hypothetical protein